jgi:BCCT family betaine/carnitine transporter
VPLLAVALLLCISIVRAANYDMRYQPDYSMKEINIGEFPDDDPWSEEGTWDIEEEGEEGKQNEEDVPIAAKPKPREPKPHVEGDPHSKPSRL